MSKELQDCEISPVEFIWLSLFWLSVMWRDNHGDSNEVSSAGNYSCDGCDSFMG